MSVPVTVNEESPRADESAVPIVSVVEAPTVVGVRLLEVNVPVTPDGRADVVRSADGGVEEPDVSVKVTVYVVDEPLRTVLSAGVIETVKS